MKLSASANRFMNAQNIANLTDCRRKLAEVERIAALAGVTPELAAFVNPLTDTLRSCLNEDTRLAGEFARLRIVTDQLTARVDAGQMFDARRLAKLRRAVREMQRRRDENEARQNRAVSEMRALLEALHGLGGSGLFGPLKAGLPF